MQTWMEGYESDIEYTAGYYREQEPDFLNLCAMVQGVSPIDIEKGFNYCELGCGLGMTSLLMAANYPQGKFYAVDFNPAHIAKARSLAEQAGLKNVIFLEKSFAQINEDPTLIPECEFISLHGIFTWVSDENRQHIIDICRKHLKSGGMVYNSYNAKPGWSIGEPIQKLMISAGKLFTGNSLSRFEQSVVLLKKFSELNPRFFGVNKSLIEKRMEILDSKDKNYLVHEYFNEGWRAFYFTEIAEYLAPAKLEFVGEAHPATNYAMSLLPDASQKFLKSLQDVNTRELFKDVTLNTVFRKDIYMRGISGRQSVDELVRFMRSKRWVLRQMLQDQDKFEFDLPGLGKVSGKGDIYKPLLGHLVKGPSDFAALQSVLKISEQNLTQALLLLYGQAIIGIEYDCSNTDAAHRLNKVLAEQILKNGSVPYLAMPGLRTTARLKAGDVLFFKAISEVGEEASPQALVDHAVKALKESAIGFRNNGQLLTGDALLERLYELEKTWRIDVLPTLFHAKAVG